MIYFKPTDPIKLEFLLGQNIEEAKKILQTDFTISDSAYFPNVFFSKLEVVRNFHKTPYSYLSIELDDTKKIKSITIHFTKKVDNTFYNSLISYYGKPSKIHVVDTKKVSEGYGNSEFKQYLKQSIITTREGTLKENPIAIFWNEKKYQIKVLNEFGTLFGCDLTFRLPTDKF